MRKLILGILSLGMVTVATSQITFFGTIVSNQKVGIATGIPTYVLDVNANNTNMRFQNLPGSGPLLVIDNAGLVSKGSEQDPIFSSSPASNVTNTLMTNWSSAFSWGNHATFGYLKGIDTLNLSSLIAQKLNITTAASTYEPKITGTVSTDYWGGDKTFHVLNSAAVGLGNVNNTSDLAKPISTATQTALNTKLNIPSGTSAQYLDGTGAPVTFPSIPAAQVSADWSSSSGVSQILNKPSTLSGYGITDAQAKLNGSGFVKVSGTTVSYDGSTYLTAEVDGSVTNEIELPSQTGNSGKVLSTNGSAPSWVTLPSSGIYQNTGTTTSGSVVFYLTSDKTASGTALYTNVRIVMPIVNDVTLNYTYGWTISVDKKTLTVTARYAPGLNVALVGLTLLGVPVNVPNGTSVSVLVIGD